MPGTFFWQLVNTNDTEIARNGHWFNVLYVNPGPRTAVVQVNQSAARLYVDHPLLNDTPTARMLIIPRWDGQVLTHRIKKPVMVAYDSTRKQWYICHNDSSLLPFGAKFNVLVDDRIICTEVETDRLEGTAKNILRIDTETNTDAGRFCWTTSFLGDGYSFNNYVGVGPAQQNLPGIYALNNQQRGQKSGFLRCSTCNHRPGKPPKKNENACYLRRLWCCKQGMMEVGMAGNGFRAT